MKCCRRSTKSAKSWKMQLKINLWDDQSGIFTIEMENNISGHITYYELTCVAIPTDREFTSPSRYAISMVARASSSLGVTCLSDPLVKLESPTSMSNTN